MMMSGITCRTYLVKDRMNEVVEGDKRDEIVVVEVVAIIGMGRRKGSLFHLN